MLIFVISLLNGVLFGYLYSFINNGHWLGCSISFVLVTIITFFIANKLVQRPFTIIVTHLQKKIQDNQLIMQNKIQQMQRRGGNPLGLESTMMSMQKKSITEALNSLKKTIYLFKWSFLIKKQVYTLRFQLLYQNKNFSEADKLISGVMLMDHLTVAMVMASAYRKAEFDKDNIAKWQVSKIYKKAVWRLRGGNAAFIHSLYGWMLVKKGVADESIKFLNKAVTKVDDGIIKDNLTSLKNNKETQYSMTRYGDLWWSLYLQDPPKQKVKRVTR